MNELYSNPCRTERILMSTQLIKLNLRLFADVTNATTSSTSGNNLSAEMKTFYDKTLIDLAEPALVHDKFGQKRPIPKNGGKIIEFRKYNNLPKALTPLVEGVTPDGQAMDVSTVTSTVSQYGGYIRITDLLDLSAIDKNIVEATKLIGSQAGRTLDTITREIINGGTNVQYAEGQVASRSLLEKTHTLTIKAIEMAVRALKAMDAPMIDGAYQGIIHPNALYDLRQDPQWRDIGKYSNHDLLHKPEAGIIAGVRFHETTEAKVYMKGGKDNADVYSTLIIGANAYGVTEIEGGGLKTIVKQLGSGGSSDPLDQRATVGWKATKTAERLIEQYMIRIETGSAFSVTSN